MSFSHLSPVSPVFSQSGTQKVQLDQRSIIYAHPSANSICRCDFPSASGILAGWKIRAARPNKNGLVVYASAAIIKRKEPIIRIPLLATGYRLCVYASGSLITVILKGKPVSVSFNSFIMLPASAGHRNNWPWPLRR